MLTHINTFHRLDMQIELQQMDSGANRNVTNDRSIREQSRNISRIPVYGAGNKETACYLTGKGFLYLQSTTREWIKTEVFYSKGCSGTILSPNTIVKENHMFSGWTQTSHMDNNTANIIFFHRNALTRPVRFTLHGKNDLWYQHQPYIDTIQMAKRLKVAIITSNIPTIHRLQKAFEHELWHQRLVHPGEVVTQHIHQCVDGIPKSHRHPLHKCKICDNMKIAFNRRPIFTL